MGITRRGEEADNVSVGGGQSRKAIGLHSWCLRGYFVVFLAFFDGDGQERKLADSGCLQIYTPEVVVVEKLEESVRGAGGFGSTG